MGVFDTFQVPYSALRLDHEELIHEASAAGGGIIIRNGVASGGPDREDPYGDSWEKAGLEELLGGMSRMAFLLRFTISHPDLDTTIVGTLSPEHLQDNIDALLKGPLLPDLYQEAKRRASTVESVESLRRRRG